MNVVVDGKPARYAQVEALVVNDDTFTAHLYVSDPETIKKLNAGSTIGFSLVNPGFNETSARLTLRERIKRIRQNIGFAIEAFGIWLQGE